MTRVATQAALGLLLLVSPRVAWSADDKELEPVCSTAELSTLPELRQRLAVAWVGPWRQQPRGWLHVVPTSELRAWLSTQDPTYTGRTLQYLGLRRRNTDPGRRYKVVIYDVDAQDLCRTITDVEGGVAGLSVCPPRLSRTTRGRTGCGTTTDRRTGEPSATSLAVRRRPAAARGHCEVPLDRYLDEVGR